MELARSSNNESDWLIPGENTRPTIPGESFKCTISRSAVSHLRAFDDV